jgi:DNA-binding CsgD family transcriptional regulator
MMWCGLSDRDGVDLSFDGQVAAVLAVADAMGAGRFRLFGPPRAADGRELEVAGLVAEGLTNQAIASRLSIAPRTAGAHVENIRRKLQVRSRAQIAAWVTERRLRP